MIQFSLKLTTRIYFVHNPLTHVFIDSSGKYGVLQCIHHNRSVSLQLWLPVESLAATVTIPRPA